MDIDAKPPPPDLSRFLEMVRKFGDVLKSAHVTVIAYHSGDKWVNLTTLVKFGGTEGQETAFDVDHRMMVYSTRKTVMEAASVLYEAAQNGKMQVLINTVFFPSPSSSFLQQRMNQVFFYNTSYDPGQNSATILTVNGNNLMDAIIAPTQTDYQSLESDIQSLDPPYLGIEDLAESIVGYPIGKAYQTTLYALLLIPCKLLGGNVSLDGKLQLRLRRDPKFTRSDIAFGIVVKPEAGASQRHTIELAKTKTVLESEGVELVQVDVPITAYTEVVVQLRARKEILEITRLYPGLSSSRLLCHGILDPDLVFLEKSLTTAGGVPFEQGVAMLLHLAGFKIEITGSLERLSSGSYADILAFTPDEESLIIGSCVFNTIKPQDITLLAQSNLVTQRTLENRKCYTLPIIFSSMPEKTIPSSLQDQAQRENIRICSREEILKALGLVKSGAGPRELLQLLGRGVWLRF